MAVLVPVSLSESGSSTERGHAESYPIGSGDRSAIFLFYNNNSHIRSFRVPTLLETRPKSRQTSRAP